MPTYVLAKADLAKQQIFIERLAVLRKQAQDNEVDHLLFVGESMIWDYQAMSKVWFPKGKQKKVKTFGKHWGAKLIGSLDYVTGEVFFQTFEKYKAQEFLRFLGSVVKKHCGKRIVMVLDNARIHHAKLIQPFLKEHENVLTLEYLPPYSPNLNLIDGLWGWLKNSVVNNVFFKSVEEIKEAVEKFIAKINLTPTKTVDRLCMKLEKHLSNCALIN